MKIDPKSESRLNCQTQVFQTYSQLELVEILKSRVEQAFPPESVSDEVIGMIAEEVAAVMPCAGFFT